MLRYTVGLYTFTFLDVIEIRWGQSGAGAEARYLRKLRSEIGVRSTYLMKEDEAQKGEHERMQHDYFSSDRAQIR